MLLCWIWCLLFGCRNSFHFPRRQCPRILPWKYHWRIVHTREKMVFPKDRGEKIYFANEGNAVHCDQPIRVAVEHFKFGDKPHFARYLGSIVTDIHRTILCGGSRQRVIFDSCMEVSPWYLQVLLNGRITSHKQMLDAHEIIHIYHSRDTIEII